MSTDNFMGICLGIGIILLVLLIVGGFVASEVIWRKATHMELPPSQKASLLCGVQALCWIIGVVVLGIYLGAALIAGSILSATGWLR